MVFLLKFQVYLSVISSLYDVKVNILALVMGGHTILMSDTINNGFPHLSDSSQNVYVFSDACHLLKNIRGSLHAL